MKLSLSPQIRNLDRRYPQSAILFQTVRKEVYNVFSQTVDKKKILNYRAIELGSIATDDDSYNIQQKIFHLGYNTFPYSGRRKEDDIIPRQSPNVYQHQHILLVTCYKWRVR
ncbi:hypothetical protein CEXT_715791 [Caerostris extrusa]|uniref:Uncharacterized protein n=1 Tax=Caerostris extrusa TaxID=172846 RepID=A0AAV4N4D5_CAEEX|nr:hypothetical protein CEXT_715791 [Caerostris extrusa]